jgi:HEAT repeat protein
VTVIDDLVARLSSDDEDERRAAVEALDDLDDPRTIEPLARVLLDGGEDEFVRRAALLALGDFGAETRALIEEAAADDRSAVLRDEARLLLRDS